MPGGWAVSNGVLRKDELDHLENKNGEALHGVQNVIGRSKDGLILKTTWHDFGIDNVVVAMKESEYGKPQIKRVYRIFSDNETENVDIRRDIVNVERKYGERAPQAFGVYYPDRPVVGDSIHDYDNYRTYVNNRKNGIQSEGQGLQNGGRDSEDFEAAVNDTDRRYSISDMDESLSELAEIASRSGNMQLYAQVMRDRLEQAARRVAEDLDFSFTKNNPVSIYARLANDLGSHMYTSSYNAYDTGATPNDVSPQIHSLQTVST